MTYVDQAYYNDTYKGDTIPSDEFDSLEQRASELIDDLTQYRIVQSDNGIDDYSDFVKTQFKKSVCAQIEFLYANSGPELLTSDNMQSAGLGKFSYSSGCTGKTRIIAPMAYRYLDQTGLIYGGL